MIGRLSRRKYLSLAAAGLLSGCIGGGGDVAADVDGGGSGGSSISADASNGPPTKSFKNPSVYGVDRFAREKVDVIGKDNIPSIDEPRFVSGDPDFLGTDDWVFGVSLNGEVKAYPRKILSHHEIVNDDMDGKKISVTYCPLTGTAIGYYRGGTTFGVSGDLVNSNLIMYDRATETFWPQILGAGVEGAMKGRRLQEFRVVWAKWSSWRDRHPDGKVLSTDTGYFRDYESDPYGGYSPRTGYYSSDSLIYQPIEPNNRFPPKKLFVGARSGEGAIAFDKQRLREKNELRGTPSKSSTTYTAVYDDDLDAAHVYRGELSSKDGKEGDEVNSFDAMWFAWMGFYPESTVVV